LAHLQIRVISLRVTGKEQASTEGTLAVMPLLVDMDIHSGLEILEVVPSLMKDGWKAGATGLVYQMDIQHRTCCEPMGSKIELVPNLLRLPSVAGVSL